MLDGQDVALMRLAYVADLGGSAALPAGLTAMTNAGLALRVQNGPMIRGPGSYIDQVTNGLYNDYESRVLATVGILNGVTTATLAFSDATGKVHRSAVYRFFDTTTGSHFFTPSQTERGAVIATRADLVNADLVNEGIAFYTAKS